MGQAITLRQVVNSLYDYDPLKTIYVVEPWNYDSLSVIQLEPESGETTIRLENLKFTYFLEVSIAQEFLTSWQDSQESFPTDQQCCQRLVEYALHDA